MASIISSSSNTSLPPSWASESNSTTLRDVSFSSYLNSSEEAYVRTLVQSTQSLRISDPRHESRKKADDVEIDVFGAEKYFNGGIQEENSRGVNSSSRKHQQYEHQHQHQHQQEYHNQQYLKDHSTPHSRLKVMQQPRTPSSHSESSWNSQNALLKRVQRYPSRGSSSSNNNNNNNTNNSSKTQGMRSFLPCYCCDKNSIDIEERAEITHSNKTTDTNLVFPVSEGPPSRSLVKTVQKAPLADSSRVDDSEEEEGRKSLEVFGSNELDIDGEGSKRFNLERRLSMLSWDAIPRPVEEKLINLNNPSSAGPPSESYRDETGSEASSDLFEIECLSCTANPVVVGVGPRPPSPDQGCPTPTTCYAPSEASIEWSVVTASAADFSAISDSEDQRSTASTAKPPRRALPGSKPKPAGILLGCKSQKAVRVAEARPIRKVNKSEKQRTQMMSKYSEQGFGPMTTSRFQAEAKVMGGYGGHKQRQEVVRSPRWSHSSHASELLYIQ